MFSLKHFELYSANLKVVKEMSKIIEINNFIDSLLIPRNPDPKTY
jgi:hypothetical protein